MLFLYSLISFLSYPVIRLILKSRRKKGKEDPERYLERYGLYTIPRPKGSLIWIHGASVGECLSALPLINELVKHHSVMVTSGTVTSAQIMKKRLPSGAFHQYIPVDYPIYVQRFLKHFKPNAGIFIDSDFWPNLLRYSSKKMPLILANGRISDRSFERWQKFPFFIKPLLACFKICFGQSRLDTERLQRLGASKTYYVGNLKSVTANSPFDPMELEKIQNEIGNRTFWLASSTHENEEEQIGGFLKKVNIKNLLTIIIPRHNIRGADIRKTLENQGFSVHQRSLEENFDCDIYIADTMGETGLFYALSSVVFVGGSLIAHGGQNMLEPMKESCAVFVGPYTFNFKEIMSGALDWRAIIQLRVSSEFDSVLTKLLSDIIYREKQAANAKKFANNEMAVLDKMMPILYPIISEGK